VTNATFDPEPMRHLIPTNATFDPDQCDISSIAPITNSKEDNLCDPLRGFDQFWNVYPERNGRKLHKAQAVARWKKLSLDERRAAWRGARHYAAFCNDGLNIARDAERFLRDRDWEEWQDPVTPKPTEVVSNEFDPTAYNPIWDEAPE
jgi:hypothetical protein